MLLCAGLMASDSFYLFYSIPFYLFLLHQKSCPHAPLDF